MPLYIVTSVDISKPTDLADMFGVSLSPCFLIFDPYGSCEAGYSLSTLSSDMGTFPAIENFILITLLFENGAKWAPQAPPELVLAI